VRSLDDLLAEGVTGRRVLVRADLNVPLAKDRPGVITDDGRIRAVLPTLSALRDAGARLVVMSHLGRPKGTPDPTFSLAPVARRMTELGFPVTFAGDTVGEQASAAISALRDGGAALLENLRFNPGETSKDEAERTQFARALAGFGDAYVDDAFGAVHRKHASVYDVPKLLPHYAGLLVLREVEVLRRLTDNPDRPYAVVLGGAKVSDKLAVIETLLPTVDRLLIGGGMCFTFLAALGNPIGTSLFEAAMVDDCRRLLDQHGDRLVLPTDITALGPGGELMNPGAGGEVRQLGTRLAEGWTGVDIGPGTAADFGDRIAEARTVFWNGPMGVFEDPRFEAGTRAVAQAMVDADGFTVVGGGDSAAALAQFGLGDGVDHISTGGGASLELLEKGDLPGLAALRGEWKG